MVLSLRRDLYEPWLASAVTPTRSYWQCMARRVWRSHVDDSRVGIARYLPVAEAHLYRALSVGAERAMISLAA
jgi:hypothetical protein